MPMPKMLKIGPIIYTIQHSHEAMQEYGKSSGNDVLGCFQAAKANIIVDEGYTLQKQRRTILHESLHALHFEYDMDNVNLKTDNEHYVWVMATALLQFLRDNPALVAYLTEE